MKTASRLPAKSATHKPWAVTDEACGHKNSVVQQAIVCYQFQTVLGELVRTSVYSSHLPKGDESA